MRVVKMSALAMSLMFVSIVQAEGKLNTKDARFIPKEDILALDIAAPDQRWEFAEEEWCEYAAKMGAKLLELGGRSKTGNSQVEKNCLFSIH